MFGLERHLQLPGFATGIAPLGGFGGLKGQKQAIYLKIHPPYALVLRLGLGCQAKTGGQLGGLDQVFERG